MQVKYEPLFRLQLAHGYFPEGHPPTISITPTTATALIMKNLGIRMVERNYGVELYYNNGEGRDRQLMGVDAPVNLSFMIRPGDPLFLNYTNLPRATDRSSVYYLNNLTPQPGQPAGTFMVANGKPLTTHPEHFSLKIKTPGSTITLKDELGKEIYVFDGDVDQGNAPPLISFGHEDKSTIQLNLAGEPAGYYSLMEGEEMLEEFILTPQNWQPGDVGLLSVYLGDTGEKGQHILIDGVVTPQDFKLVFPVRETKWRYFFIDGNNTGYTNHQLLDANTQQPIDPPAEDPSSTEMPDGSIATVITTPSAIPLLQQPQPRYMLRIQPTTPDQAAPLTITLPSADANRISIDQSTSPDASEASVFYSDLYVYL